MLFCFFFSNFDGDVPSDAAFSDPNADADAAAAAACRFPGVKLLHADPMVLVGRVGARMFCKHFAPFKFILDEV